MFEVKEYMDKQYKIYELSDKDSGSYVKVAPERGGIITGFGIDGAEILYMDEDTFYDPGKYVRGGIPILFPICGALNNSEYVHNGIKYNMENHGLARNFPWQIIETNTEGGASISIKLKSNETTKKNYPFDFELIFTYVLKGNILTIEQEYINNSDVDMPMYAGLHPYFNITDKSRLQYNIDASKYLDFNGIGIKPYNGKIDMSNEEMSKIFLDVKENNVSFYDENLKRKISMEYSKEFKYMVLWSVPGKNFICVEPFMAMPDSMNTKEDLFLLGSGESLKVSLCISCTNGCKY